MRRPADLITFLMRQVHARRPDVPLEALREFEEEFRREYYRVNKKSPVKRRSK